MPFSSRTRFTMDKAAPQTTARAAPRLWPVNQSVGCQVLESGGFGGGGLTELSASLILSHEWRTAMAKPVWTSPVSGAPSTNHEKRAGAEFTFVIQSSNLAVPRKETIAYSAHPAANP